MNNFTMLITEYPKKQARVMLMMARGVIRGTGYVITTGNINRMKKSTDSDTVDGITRIISQDIFKDRFMQVICISLNTGTEDMYGVDIRTLEETMGTLLDKYKSDDILIINMIPFQIFNNSNMGSSDSEDAVTVFRRYGFIDVSGDYDIKAFATEVPKHVMVKFNDVGAIPFTLNGEIW